MNQVCGADPGWVGGWLTIDLDAIVANWRSLADRVAPAECAAVVKADAYGLGLAQVAPALAAAGCRSFFVAHLVEGVTLRALLPRQDIYVLHGVMPGTAPVLARHGLMPVLNSLGQVAEWQALAASLGRALPAALQIDTGMSRFGLQPDEVEQLGARPGACAGIEMRLVMSHLGCADQPGHPANAAQRDAFLRLRRWLPDVPASLAASSGVFLEREFHLDMVRPGAALYGVAPNAARPNPMRAAIRLQGRVVQTRTVEAGSWVGYGAAFTAERRSRIATVAVGYADGFLRAGGGNGMASLPEGGTLLPIVGRISMDCLAVDVTGLRQALPEGAALDLIGPHWPLEDAAAAAGTIGYELLTALGSRYHRVYAASGADWRQGSQGPALDTIKAGP